MRVLWAYVEMKSHLFGSSVDASVFLGEHCGLDCTRVWSLLLYLTHATAAIATAAVCRAQHRRWMLCVAAWLPSGASPPSLARWQTPIRT